MPNVKRLPVTKRTGLLLAFAVVMVSVVSSNIGGNLGIARAADPPAYFAGDDLKDTVVSIVGEKFQINGTFTNPQMLWNGSSVEGMLLNTRMVNGIYDDMDGTVHPNMSPWDPRANTDDFIANMQDWADYGVNALAMNMQGGSNDCCGYSGDDQISQGVLNNPFGSTGTQAFDEWAAGGGTPRSDYLHRLGSVIRKADDLGMVVMLGLFYFGQDNELAGEVAVEAAVDATAGWIIENGWTNVIIEIANESLIEVPAQPDRRLYDHPNLQVETVSVLIDRVKTYCTDNALDCSHLPGGRLLASSSLGGGTVPGDDIITASDFVLLHGNGQTSARVTEMVAEVQLSASFITTPKPIVFNEDGTDPANFDAAIAAGASWGYYDQDAYQTVFRTTDPTRWTVTRQSGGAFCDSFWARTAASTTTATVDQNGVLIPYRLAVSTEQTRVRSVPLDGQSITGDIFVHVEPSLGVTRAYFWLDSPDPVIDELDIGTEIRSEGVAPLDFSGGSLTCGNSFDTTTIADGNDHTITALLDLGAGGYQTITATFNPGEAPADITGQVQLKGVSDQAKFVAMNPRVTITPVGGAESAPIPAASDGSILLLATLPGNYTLKAYADGYLPAETAPFLLAGDAIDMPPVTLRGGDATHDGIIDGADIAVLLAAFGTSTVNRVDGSGNFVDINGDDFVTMIDASILISNFPAVALDPWPTTP